MNLCPLSSAFCDENRIIVEGSVTIDNVLAITQRGIRLLHEDHRIIDLGKVVKLDSAIISMMLEWLRTAQREHYQLQFINIPPSLISLIQLYGIVELIPSTENLINR